MRILQAPLVLTVTLYPELSELEVLGCFCGEFICFVGTKWIGEAEVELSVIQSLGIFGPSLPGHQKSRLNLHYC